MALVTLRSYRDPIDAELAKVQLENAGIPAIVADQHLVGVQWLYSIAIGGVKVKVDASDLAGAREVLREDRSGDLAEIPESGAAPADGDECPVCGSPQVKPSRVQRIAGALSLAIDLPIPVWRNRWICQACGHSWRPHPDRHAEVPPVTLAAEREVYEQRSYPELRVWVVALLGLLILCYVKYRIDHPG